MIFIKAFLFCGTVCLIAQIIYDYTKLTPGHITSLFVIIGSCLELFHIYDYLIEWFGAGALLPITSFGHSLTHSALSKIDSHGLLGVCMGMFDMTAAGITSAIFFAFIFAIICKPKS